MTRMRQRTTQTMALGHYSKYNAELVSRTCFARTNPVVSFNFWVLFFFEKFHFRLIICSSFLRFYKAGPTSEQKLALNSFISPRSKQMKTNENRNSTHLLFVLVQTLVSLFIFFYSEEKRKTYKKSFGLIYWMICFHLHS